VSPCWMPARMCVLLAVGPVFHWMPARITACRWPRIPLMDAGEDLSTHRWARIPLDAGKDLTTHIWRFGMLLVSHCCVPTRIRRVPLGAVGDPSTHIWPHFPLDAPGPTQDGPTSVDVASPTQDVAASVDGGLYPCFKPPRKPLLDEHENSNRENPRNREPRCIYTIEYANSESSSLFFYNVERNLFVRSPHCCFVTKVTVSLLGL
jgi:hypothetical protein